MDERLVRQTVIAGKIVLLGFLLLADGCREQTPKQIVEARLRAALPENSGRLDVEGYLQREHVEVWKHARNTVSARFHDVKNDIFCRVDVNVEFVFNQSGRLIQNSSQEMRTCI